MIKKKRVIRGIVIQLYFLCLVFLSSVHNLNIYNTNKRKRNQTKTIFIGCRYCGNPTNCTYVHLRVSPLGGTNQQATNGGPRSGRTSLLMSLSLGAACLYIHFSQPPSQMLEKGSVCKHCMFPENMQCLLLKIPLCFFLFRSAVEGIVNQVVVLGKQP